MRALGQTAEASAQAVAAWTKYLSSLGSWNTDTNFPISLQHASSTFRLRSVQQIARIMESNTSRWCPIQTRASNKILPCSSVISNAVQICGRLGYVTCSWWLPGCFSQTFITDLKFADHLVLLWEGLTFFKPPLSGFINTHRSSVLRLTSLKPKCSLHQVFTQTGP